MSDSINAQNTRRSTRLLSSARNTSLNTHGLGKDPKRSTKTVSTVNAKKISSQVSLPFEVSIGLNSLSYGMQKGGVNKSDAVSGSMSDEEREEAEIQMLGLFGKIGEGCYALSR